jgi:hypothetical protein
VPVFVVQGGSTRFSAGMHSAATLMKENVLKEHMRDVKRKDPSTQGIQLSTFGLSTIFPVFNPIDRL